MNFQGAQGATLLRCLIRPAYALTAIFIGALFIGIFFLLSSADLHSKSSPGFNIFVLLFGFGILLMGINDMINAQVLFEVTESGIMLYVRRRAKLEQASLSIVCDLFIPWERVEFIYFLDRKQVFAAGLSRMSGRYAYPLVVLRIRRDFDWPPASSLQTSRFRTQNTRPDEIYITAYHGTIRGTHLYQVLEELRARYTRMRSAEA